MKEKTTKIARNIGSAVSWDERLKRIYRLCLVGAALIALIFSCTVALPAPTPQYHYYEESVASRRQSLVTPTDEVKYMVERFLEPENWREITFVGCGSPAEGLEQFDSTENAEQTRDFVHYVLCTSFAVGPYDSATPDLDFCLPDLGQSRISMAQRCMSDNDFLEVTNMRQAGDFLVTTRVDEYGDGYYAKIKFFLPVELLETDDGIIRCIPIVSDLAELERSIKTSRTCNVFEQVPTRFLKPQECQIKELCFSNAQLLEEGDASNVVFDISVN